MPSSLVSCVNCPPLSPLLSPLHCSTPEGRCWVPIPNRPPCPTNRQTALNDWWLLPVVVSLSLFFFFFLSVLLIPNHMTMAVLKSGEGTWAGLSTTVVPEFCKEASKCSPPSLVTASPRLTPFYPKIKLFKNEVLEEEVAEEKISDLYKKRRRRRM